MPAGNCRAPFSLYARSIYHTRPAKRSFEGNADLTMISRLGFTSNHFTTCIRTKYRSMRHLLNLASCLLCTRHVLPFLHDFPTSVFPMPLPFPSTCNSYTCVGLSLVETFFHEEQQLHIPGVGGKAVARAGGGETSSSSEQGAARLAPLKEAWGPAGGLCADRYRNSAISRTSSQTKPVPAGEKR